ncbi:MAG: sigma-54-dependent Fis family transcriptional regulator [Bacteroidetes bacterium]|nr:sigma-54-dependent Fis family transcriptional regulator [Bacteroidota bacterium]
MKKIPIKIFVVEDDPIYRSLLVHFLSLNPDYQVKSYENAASFYKDLTEQPEIITLDYNLPDATGELVLDKILQVSPQSKVIFISVKEDIKTAINLFKKGVHDYIIKDEDVQQRLWVSIQNLKENILLKKEVASLKNEVEKKLNLQHTLIGQSEGLKKVLDLMQKAAQVNITTSITGETGTGKDLVAKSLHNLSAQKDHPFIAINVAAIPHDLLESELFGHEKGAFTGAASRRLGKMEEAQNGTLFLDEIGDMNLNMQAKLLRALQEKELTRVGGNEVIKINVRIIVATHRNLLMEVKKGKFREDLYYRLLGLNIYLPPLRERSSDIILLANFFIETFCKENGIHKKHLGVEAKKKLLKYHFPGNIRELKSIIELACVLTEKDEIEPAFIQLQEDAHSVYTGLGHYTLKEYNEKLVEHYLQVYDHDVMTVAHKLGIGKTTVYRIIQRKRKEILSK